MKKNKQQTPVLVIGDGATYFVGSDRYPYTIVEISKTGKTVKVQRDNAKNTVAWPDQEWKFTANPDAPIETLTKRSDGAYRQKGTRKCRGVGWNLNGRDKYLNPSF